MTAIPVFDEPLEVSTEDGEVVITGPDGLCASLTPQAARESVRRLAEALARLGGGEPQKEPLD